MHIDSLLRTISVLDPLEARIEEMSAEERASFKLGPDLGGWSPAVYQKVIKKVYGREAASEVYRALQEFPGVAVPVVLARLKQKSEEWKRLQREWNRTLPFWMLVSKIPPVLTVKTTFALLSRKSSSSNEEPLGWVV